MSLRSVLLAAVIGALVVVAGCSSGSGPDTFVAAPEPWRAKEEQACLASGYVRETPYLHVRASLGGSSALGAASFCGAERPFEMSGADGGRVVLKPSAQLRCEMIPQVEQWVHDVVEPAALAVFGQPVVELKVLASYSCRPIDSIPGAKLSEHGHANAVDIGGFVLADGRTILVKTGWRGGEPSEERFLARAHDGACHSFTTVLGPEADRFHQDHFHLDLARHGRDGLYRVCK